MVRPGAGKKALSAAATHCSAFLMLPAAASGTVLQPIRIANDWSLWAATGAATTPEAIYTQRITTSGASCLASYVRHRHAHQRTAITTTATHRHSGPPTVW